MFEVERKRELQIDKASFIELLLKLGFLATSKSREIDTYYSRPDIDYMRTVECLRVRQKDGFAEMTYKPPTTDATNPAEGVIAKEELDVRLGDESQALLANKLLETIGMVKLVTIDKKRETFKRDEELNVSVLIDEVTDAGVFIEIEVMASDAEEAHTRLESLEDELGVRDFPIADKPYRDIVMANQEEAQG